jgi:hypothetical protein
MADDTLRAFYEALADAKDMTARALCMGDYMSAPTIAQLDFSDYKGRVGDPIFVITHDEIAWSMSTFG